MASGRLIVRGWILSAVLLGGLCMGAGGCLFIGSSTEKKGPPPTLGQELIDLKAARENGAMSNEEYDLAKSNLLRSTHR